MEHTYFFAVDLGATSGRTILGCLGNDTRCELYKYEYAAAVCNRRHTV